MFHWKLLTLFTLKHSSQIFWKLSPLDMQVWASFLDSAADGEKLAHIGVTRCWTGYIDLRQPISVSHRWHLSQQMQEFQLQAYMLGQMIPSLWTCLGLFPKAVFHLSAASGYFHVHLHSRRKWEGKSQGKFCSFLTWNSPHYQDLFLGQKNCLPNPFHLHNSMHTLTLDFLQQVLFFNNIYTASASLGVASS